jgi:DNA repair ATPase RecN
MNVEEQLVKLIEGVSSLTTKVDSVQKSVEDMKTIASTVAAHGSAIGEIKESLLRGNKKFDKIDTQLEKVDERLDKLERADGEKAKITIKTIVQYLLVAVVGAIVSNIPIIINTLAGGK